MSWKIFVLGRDKTPLPNCERCRSDESTHDRESCRCLTCHAIYAATDDPVRITAMKERFPNHPWAVRTGRESGIIVLDAEGHGVPSGIDVLDAFENWTNGVGLQTTGMIASTPSGGVHRYYSYVPGVRSRNRVLPGVDIKSDGGYVVIPQLMTVANVATTATPDREWYLAETVADPVGPFREWLLTARGHSHGFKGGATRGDGYDYERFVREGCPGGSRDDFFNELLFRMRKAGLSRQDATVRARDHWKRCEQPPAAEWHMPWWNVEYKLERIWKTVGVDEVTEEQRSWVNAIVAKEEPTRVGRITLAGRDAKSRA